MKKHILRIALLIPAAMIIIAAGTKSSHDSNSCGSINIHLPLSFFGSIIGCSGDTGVQPSSDSNENPAIKQKELNHEAVVTIVELGSPNCPACVMMQPVYEEIEEKYSSRGVEIISYDIGTREGRPYGKKYGVRGIPTHIFLDKDGSEFFRHTGFFSVESIEKVLRSQGIK